MTFRSRASISWQGKPKASARRNSRWRNKPPKSVIDQSEKKTARVKTYHRVYETSKRNYPAKKNVMPYGVSPVSPPRSASAQKSTVKRVSAYLRKDKKKKKTTTSVACGRHAVLNDRSEGLCVFSWQAQTPDRRQSRKTCIYPLLRCNPNTLVEQTAQPGTRVAWEAELGETPKISQ